MQEVWLEVPEGWEPEPVFAQDHKRSGRARCLHWIFKLGRQCKSSAKKGISIKPHPVDGYKQKCTIHGGNSPEGVEHYNWKGGRYAKDAGESRQKKLDRLLNDDDLLRLNDNIALIDFRITELFESLKEGGSPGELWKQAVRSWNYLDRAIDSIDADGIDKHTKELGAILEKGIREIATWDEIDKRTETRRKLTDSESRRRKDMQYLVMVEDTVRDYRIIGALARQAIMNAEITKEVKGEILERIQEGFSDYMHRDIPGAIETPSNKSNNIVTMRSEWKKLQPVLSPLILKQANNKCNKCGSPKNLTIDHIKALANGGDNSIANLQALCQSCNSKKGTAP